MVRFVTRSLDYLHRWMVGFRPVQLVCMGYSSYVLFGFLALCLPICHHTLGLHAIDHLFISASAVSTTGLATISVGHDYNLLGQIIVLLLIQFGGLGYMVITSCTLLAFAGRVSPLRRRVTTAALSLPDGFDVRAFIKITVLFTLLIEIAGAAGLYPIFRDHGAPQPLWQAIFHSVSAFCTAGFSLLDDSFAGYRDDISLNIIITVLSYLGAIGFIVIHDLYKSLTLRKPAMTFTSRVILVSTFVIAIVGTVLFALDEPTVRDLPAGQRWLASLFQVMTASTTVGFNTISISDLSTSSMFLLTIIMILGASPSGTGGGLKTTTISALWAEMIAVVRRRSITTFLGRQIPQLRVRAATANVMFYMITLAVGIYLLDLVESAPFADQMFECASALGTVGLSRGITASLSEPGKLIIIALMCVGRMGPLLLGMALFKEPNEHTTAAPVAKVEDVAI